MPRVLAKLSALQALGLNPDKEIFSSQYLVKYTFSLVPMDVSVISPFFFLINEEIHKR